MTEPVENMNEWSRAVARDELPYHEVLCRLYELCGRYANHSAHQYITSASAAHEAEMGHRLAFGCCATQDSIMAALAREERKLLRQLEHEQYLATSAW